jgi:hypothetical protein
MRFSNLEYEFLICICQLLQLQETLDVLFNKNLFRQLYYVSRLFYSTAINN